jgi:hypothetical protein
MPSRPLCRKARAKRLVIASVLAATFAFFVVIPEGNLLLLSFLLPCLRARVQPCRSQPGQKAQPLCPEHGRRAGAKRFVYCLGPRRLPLPFCCHSRRESAVVLALIALLKGTPSAVPKTSRAKRPNRSALSMVEGLERSPKGEATDFIAVAFVVDFLLPFSAQKSHVKPENHLTLYQSTRSKWHFS